MANPLQQAGSQSEKPPRFAPLFRNYFFTGAWLQRNPLNDPGSRVEKIYYGGRQDAIISGVNVELTNNLTLSRRPGTSAYSLQTVSEAVNSFYSFKTFTTLTETIRVMMDGLTKIYTVTPAAVTSIFTKSAGATSASFLGINNWLYIGDGVDQQAWGGTGSTRNWGIAQGGLSLTSAYAGYGAAQTGVGVATSQGPDTAATAADSGISGGTGTEVWSTGSGGGSATLAAFSLAPGDGTNYLKITNLGFTVPTGATINGIAVTLQKQGALQGTQLPGHPAIAISYPQDDGVFLVKAGTVETGWTDHTVAGDWSNGFLSPTNYGNATDVWGSGGLTPADVNNSGFGVAIAASQDIHQYNSSGNAVTTATVASATITVYYTPANQPTWANPTRVEGAPDASYTTAVPSNNAQTAGLLATDYGFSLSGTVVGVQVNVTAHVSAASPNTTIYAQLLDDNGNPMGIQKSFPLTSATDVVISFGGMADLWGSAINQTMVNSATATITNTALTSNVATYTAANSFVAGQLVTVTGSTNGGGVFNIVNQPVVSATATTFTIAITHANVGSAGDTGTTFTGFGVEITVSGNGQTFSVDSAQMDIWTGAITVGHTGSGSFSATVGYKYVYEYSNGTVAPPVFSNASPSASTGIFTSALAATIGVVASTDPQVTGIWIFRTTDGGSTFFSLPTNPYPNITGTINDNNPDSTLNTFQLAAISLQDTPPPTGISGMVFHMGRMWGFVNNVLYYATGPDLGNILGNPYESWAPANFFTLPSQITKLIPTTVGLLVHTISDIYIVYGNGSAIAAATGVSGITVFYVAPFVTGVGLLSRFAADINGTTIYMLTTDNQILSLDPSSGISEIGFPIGAPNIAYPNDPSLATFPPANSYLTWHVNGSQDKALFASDGSTGWFRCNTSQAPEGGFVWSPKANITGGCKAVQSIETSPGVHQLLIGPGTGGGKIQVRNLSVFADLGVTYPANFIMGSIVLVYPGQLAEVAFLTCDFNRIGTSPLLSVLPDEISGSFSSLSGYVHSDPPSLYGVAGSPATLYSNRYDWAQTVAGQAPPSLFMRHLQVQVDFGSTDGVKNELMSFTIYGAHWSEM